MGVGSGLGFAARSKKCWLAVTQQRIVIAFGSLRHYHNQHLKDRLDRFIGAQLLRYAMAGHIPPEFSIASQASNLDGLARLLELDGFRCTAVAEVGGRTVPLLVERGAERAVVGTQSAVVAVEWTGTPSRPC